MLAESVELTSINDAVKAYAEDNGVSQLRWISNEDEDTCEFCIGQSGRSYKIGEFMPDIPVHPGCRCSWEIVVDAENVAAM
jgi:hypothetical protein